MSNGELNNVTDPAASGALDQALSVAVHNTLLNALSDVQVVIDNNSPSSSTDTATSREKIMGEGDVVEIGGGGVKRIPLSKAPQPLKDALSNGVRNGLPKSSGH